MDLIEADDVWVHKQLQNVDLSHDFISHVETVNPGITHCLEKKSCE